MILTKGKYNGKEIKQALSQNSNMMVILESEETHEIRDDKEYNINGYEKTVFIKEEKTKMEIYEINMVTGYEPVFMCDTF